MKKYEIVIIAVLVLGITWLVFSHQGSHQGSRQVFGGVPANETTSNASTTVSTVVATVLSLATQYGTRCISNPGTGTLYLWMSPTSTGFTSASGLAVNPSTTQCLADLQGTLWSGTVFGIMSNGSTTITTSQW